MRVVLISTYELGRPPFGLASPAAWLAARGMDVRCFDLSREALVEDAIRGAGLIAFYLPMHTATRLAAQLIEPVRRIEPSAHVCCYGLYAPVNEELLRGLGVRTILGGEFEGGLLRLAERLAAGDESVAAQSEPTISLARQNFLVPRRKGLPPLAKYARVMMPGGEQRLAGYTEASRGCKHLCRHCPVVPVYAGAFRVVGREVVLADVRQQVAAGSQHVTFGDPDFFNGPAHVLAIVEELHREFPELSYDATIKIEHLRKHAEHLPRLRDTGCLFVTSAVESVDDAILARLDKGHTSEDFLQVARHFRELGMALQPTFVPFTPWTTIEGYRELLRVIAQTDLVEHVAPIQLAIRLLIPGGSRLMELREVRELAAAFDREALAYPWRHADGRVDELQRRIQSVVEQGEKGDLGRGEIFARIWRAAAEAAGDASGAAIWEPQPGARAAAPHLDEPWYCCAEPTREQFVSIAAASAAQCSAPASPRADGFV
jgi:radical SAM superfamily enzyme YgiQ (UPF0313 family)